MTYHQAFDRLGNPVYRRKVPVRQRLAALLYCAAALTGAVLLVLLQGGAR